MPLSGKRQVTCFHIYVYVYILTIGNNNSAIEDTTIDPSSSGLSTLPATCQPCGSGVNRTGIGLGDVCGENSMDGICTIPNSVCMQSRTDTSWRCRCVQGYAQKNSNCEEMPDRLFSSPNETITMKQQTTIGSTVTTILFSGISDFSTSDHRAAIIGEGSIFIVDVNRNGINLILNGSLDQYNYLLILTASVTIDNFVIRDFVEIKISVTLDIRDDIVVVDGTPKGIIVGQLCGSCITQRDEIEIPEVNFLTVNSDGNFVTSKAINLDAIQNARTIAYSTNISVLQNSNYISNLTVIIIRPQYTVSLSENSTSSTQVGEINLDLPFIVNGLNMTTQTLMLGSTKLDYESETVVEKNVSLNVSGKKQYCMEVSITIKVLDVNDEPPRFQRRTYSFLATQSGYTNLVVGVVTAEDSDLNSDLKYSLSSNESLEIDNQGVIKIVQSIERVNYTVNVSVTDDKFTDFATVFIEMLQLTNANLENKFTWNLDENKISNTSVYVTDYENYYFTDTNALKDFNIHNIDGIITNLRPFDRENPSEREFKYTITGTRQNEGSCSLVIIGEITVTITDVNDEPPVFVNSPYTATVKENADNRALNMNPISTTDKDETSTVTYLLLTNTDNFTINKNTGVISTVAGLDRETTEALTLVVMATDGINNVTALVNVTIEDVNDNAPDLSGTAQQFDVIENSPLGIVIGIIIVSDADEGKNADIELSLSKEDFFEINQTSGEIILVKNIDRERNDQQIITVTASDNGESKLSSSITITINVTDVNDNPPVFTENPLTVEFEEENMDCLQQIIQINATDADEPGSPNSQIKYSVIRGSKSVEIGEHTGVLSCRSVFDYENVSTITVVVKAEDSAETRKLSSTLTVTINVKDVNDNYPTFVNPKSQVMLRYLNIGQLVEFVIVEDQDSGDNGRVNLTISGIASSFLTIDNNGVIRTKEKPPDDGTYSLVINATDRGFPSNSDTHTMQIELVGPETQPITWSQQEITMNITENSDIYAEVGSVSSKVNKPNGTSVRYEILHKKEDLPFNIHNETGIVTVKSSLDREIEETYNFVLQVLNTAVSEQSDLVVVRIQLLDENDNAPIFEPLEYFYNVREDMDANTTLNPNNQKIKASDADIGINAQITFKITGTDSCSKKFALQDEADVNTKSIILAEPIDYEIYQECKFSVQAYNENNQTMSSTANVTVNIEDFNDNAPEFLDLTNGVYSISIREDTTIKTKIPLIGKLQDKDRRMNAHIELFNENPECLFNVSYSEMKIRLQLKPGDINIDYEKNVTSNTCIIRASDKGVPSLSATATISITITDVNDNKPYIINPDLNVNVTRDAENSIVVPEIPATDADSSENGQLIYSIEHSQYSSYFFIDQDSGEIRLKTKLTSVQIDELKIRVIVSDKGIPPLSSTATINITLVDDNHRPYFGQPPIITMKEHSLRQNGVIYKVEAYDEVKGQNVTCDCIFRLDTNRDDLTIEMNTGIIRFKDPFDSFDREAENNSRVTVNVIAQDKGDPPKDSLPMVVTINILDINDQYPRFTQNTYNFDVFQKAPDGYVIGKVTAIDRDENPVTHYFISINDDRFDPSVVSINKETGEITKSGDLTLNETTNTQLKGKVTAKDSKDPEKPPDVSDVVITIEFDDKNKHTPIFQKSLYTGDLSWEANIDAVILNVIATDNDTGVEGDVNYAIYNGNPRGFFKINSTGFILLAYKLDSSIGPSPTEIVNLTITATDGGIIPKSSNTSVGIRISGSNPGSCIQELTHQKALELLEGERDNWTHALYGVVAALCVAIMFTLFFIYKWKTSSPPSDNEKPFVNTDKVKQDTNAENYEELLKGRYVEYSQSNEESIQLHFYNTASDTDAPFKWKSEENRVLPKDITITSTGS